MPKTNNKIIFSLPSEMTKKLEKLMEEEQVTRSEVLRKALRQYIENKEWKEILRYGRTKARRKGLLKAQVENIIDVLRK